MTVIALTITPWGVTLVGTFHILHSALSSPLPSLSPVRALSSQKLRDTHTTSPHITAHHHLLAPLACSFHFTDPSSPRSSTLDSAFRLLTRRLFPRLALGNGPPTSLVQGTVEEPIIVRVTSGRPSLTHPAYKDWEGSASLRPLLKDKP